MSDKFTGLLLGWQPSHEPKLFHYDDDRMRKHLGGWYELHQETMKGTRCGDVPMTIWCRDTTEGLEPNQPLVHVFGFHYWGPVILSGPADRHGNTTDVHPLLVHAFTAAYFQMRLYAMGDPNTDELLRIIKASGIVAKVQRDREQDQ